MINLNNQIGKRVINKLNKEGTIVSVSKDYIIVKFDDGDKKFLSNAFEKGFLSFEDEDLQKEIDQERHELEKKELETQTRIRNEAIRRKITSDFGRDYNVKFLDLDKKLNYREVNQIYGITIYRGISLKKDAIYLISSVDRDNDKFVYHDHWDGNGNFIYSGEGLNGNQQLSVGNQAIIDSKQNGQKIILIVKLSPEEYYVQGDFELVKYEIVKSKGEDGKNRDEYQFTLRKI